MTGDGLSLQNHLLLASVRFSTEKIRLDDVEECSFRKEFNEHIFMDNYCV